VKSELPLFIKEFNQNPISIEEIQISFKNLIIAADLIEKEIFQKDLVKESLNIDLRKSDRKLDYRFRKASSQFFDNRWKREFEILTKSYMLEDFNGVDLEKRSLLINHQVKYVKCLKKNENWFAEVSIPSVDPQAEEIKILEKHLNVFVNGANYG
jgi:hypothetical protein